MRGKLAPAFGGGLVALVVAGACAGEPGVEHAAPEPAWESLDTGWTRLPDPPEMRDGAAYVWAGSELLAWGGCSIQVANDCVSTADGFAFDPVQETWREMPDAPFPGFGADAVWTGEDAVFVNFNEADVLQGIAYDPARDTWRTLAEAPIEPRGGGVAVWTGSELIVWGGGRPGDPATTNGAAYDPEADRWRRIAEAPLGLNLASGMWTGTEVVAFGSLLDGRNIPDTDTSVAVAYDPRRDAWRKLPASALSPQAASANWIDDRMLAWDYEVHWQTYDPSTDNWSASQPMPFEFDECYPDSVNAAGFVFAFFCGRAAVFDPAPETWGRLEGGPLADEIHGHGRPYKLWRFASLVAAGDVVFMPMQGITVTGDGTPCYGCEGSPVSMWAYRLPN
jgi:hypothetical protein